MLGSRADAPRRLHHRAGLDQHPRVAPRCPRSRVRSAEGRRPGDARHHCDLISSCSIRPSRHARYQALVRLAQVACRSAHLSTPGHRTALSHHRALPDYAASIDARALQLRRAAAIDLRPGSVDDSGNTTTSVRTSPRKMRSLAVSSRSGRSTLRELPTVAESGYPDLNPFLEGCNDPLRHAIRHRRALSTRRSACQPADGKQSPDPGP